MRPNNADGMPNSVDPEQSLIWVCTVCPGLSVRKLRIITVMNLTDLWFNSIVFQSYKMSHVMRKPAFGVFDQVDSNQSAQLKKLGGGMNLQI